MPLALRGLSRRFPAAFAGASGFAIMCVGDSTVQLAVELEDPAAFDLIRNSSSGVFQALAGAFMGTWWRFLDRRMPVLSIRKLAINQVALSGTITPGYLVWSGIIEAPLHGNPVDWPKLGTRLRTELPTLLPTSFCFWLPFNTINFMLVPVHLRVAFISSVSVAWGGYLSYVSHGRCGRARQSAPCDQSVHAADGSELKHPSLV